MNNAFLHSQTLGFICLIIDACLQSIRSVPEDYSILRKTPISKAFSGIHKLLRFIGIIKDTCMPMIRIVPIIIECFP